LVYALKSDEAQRQYPGRLKLFFDYLRLPGSSLEEQPVAFLQKSRDNNNIQWVQGSRQYN
jgi:hypothetical protein